MVRAVKGEKLIRFATRIPASRYLTDYRENTLQDAITKIETSLFETFTGLTAADFHLLCRLRVFNTGPMSGIPLRKPPCESMTFAGARDHPHSPLCHGAAAACSARVSVAMTSSRRSLPLRRLHQSTIGEATKIEE